MTTSITQLLLFVNTKVLFSAMRNFHPVVMIFFSKICYSFMHLHLMQRRTKCGPVLSDLFIWPSTQLNTVAIIKSYSFTVIF